MDMITVSAKTVDEAITKALIELETTSDKLEYEIVDKGNSGILGFINRINSTDIFNAVGIVPGKDFRDEKLKPADAPRILQDGRIDGFFYTVGHPNGNIKEATAGKRKVRIVPITEADE